MKIYSLAVFNNSSKPAKTICSESDLSSFRFFERGRYGHLLSKIIHIY